MILLLLSQYRVFSFWWEKSFVTFAKLYFCRSQKFLSNEKQKDRSLFGKKLVRIETRKRQMEDPRIQEWERKQIEIRQKVVTWDTESWQKSKLIAGDDELYGNKNAIRYIAGMDISVVKSNNSIACTALVVCELPSLKVVYKNCEWVELKAPYIPGFLTFREAEFLVAIYQKLLSTNTEYTPQAILIDGNGVLHRRGCGLACHVGVEIDIPTIGVAKNLFHVDGIAKDDEHKQKILSLTSKGDAFPLIGESGCTLAMALKSSEKADKPVYVSIGHKIGLETAVWLVKNCSIYRIPEPIRQADQLSREAVRLKYPDEVTS